jgi:hypothetical protein
MLKVNLGSQNSPAFIESGESVLAFTESCVGIAFGRFLVVFANLREALIGLVVSNIRHGMHLKFQLATG